MREPNRRVENEIKRWGNLFRTKKAKLARQGRTVSQAAAMNDAAKESAAKQKLAVMRKDYEATKSLLIKEIGIPYAGHFKTMRSGAKNAARILSPQPSYLASPQATPTAIPTLGTAPDQFLPGFPY